MEPSDDKLTPQDIDAQIEWLARYTSTGVSEDDKNAQLVQNLQRHYQKEKQQHILEQAWQSIAQKYTVEMPLLIDEVQTRHETQRNERSGHNPMQQQITDIRPTQRIAAHLGTLLAVAVLLVIIGGTAAIMSYMAQQHGSPASSGGHSPICTSASTSTPPTATPTPMPPSTTPTPMPPSTTPTPMPPSTTPTPMPPIATPTPMPPIATPTPTGCPTPTSPVVTPTPGVTPTQPPSTPPTPALHVTPTPSPQN